MTFDRRTILAGGLAMPAAIGAAAFNPAQAQRAQDTLRVVFRDDDAFLKILVAAALDAARQKR